MAKANGNEHRKKSAKPYNERTDLEKLQSQWTKLSALHVRDEPSAVIVRCATAAEIAANYAIRTEWARKTEFDEAIVDMFLRWANGLPLKVTRLFVPIYFKMPDESAIGKTLRASAEKINAVRNAVVHQGAFSNPEEAEAIIAEASAFINTIVGLSIEGFDIEVAAQEWQASRKGEASA